MTYNKEYMAAYRSKNRAKIRAYQADWKRNNPDKIKAYARAAYARNPAKVRAKQLRSKFGITLGQFISMEAEQGGCCAVCRTDSPGGRGGWHVDHNHVTGKVRGLLCNRCNMGLGYFKDDPLLLERAADYLRSKS